MPIISLRDKDKFLYPRQFRKSFTCSGAPHLGTDCHQAEITPSSWRCSPAFCSCHGDGAATSFILHDQLPFASRECAQLLLPSPPPPGADDFRRSAALAITRRRTWKSLFSISCFENRCSAVAWLLHTHIHSLLAQKLSGNGFFCSPRAEMQATQHDSCDKQCSLV